jgi:multiple sugar transport system permease protein
MRGSTLPALRERASTADSGRRRALRRRRGLHGLAHAGIIAALVIMLYPLAWLVASSVRPTADIFTASDLWPETFAWTNYSEGWNALGSVTFGTLFLNSFIVAGATIVGNVLSCSLAAYAFARLRFRFRGPLFAVMLVTIMLPYHVQVVPQYIIFNWLGWVDTFYPLIAPKFLATEAFFVFLLTQFMRQLPRELEEAARLDGCGFWGIYWRIIMPLSAPALATTAVLTLVFSWNDFFTPLLYLTSVDMYTVPLGLAAFLDAEGDSAWGPLFAMSLTSLLPIFIVFLVAQRLLVRGIATTGLK